MTPAEIRAILVVCREMGVSSVKVGDFSALLDPQYVADPSLKADEQMPTEDELLFASCPTPFDRLETQPQPPG